MKVVLASASPRRTALLTRLGVVHEVDPAALDESELPGETPTAHAARLAEAKADEVRRRHPGALVVAGDTVVARDGEILGKPDSEDHAVEMLLSLAGRSHRVVSGLALAVPGRDEIEVRLEVARVVFRPFGAEVARAYVATGEPMDKAGAYGIQGKGASLVTRVEGDYTAVVGLPVAALVDLLEAAGHPYRFGALTGNPIW